jgi:hypothetical protein
MKDLKRLNTVQTSTGKYRTRRESTDFKEKVQTVWMKGEGRKDLKLLLVE